ncbi:MAG: alpha/beta hydrolase [Alphaproteobacteria bacterium]|nr:alpha/beta hydrolase [Alphaproteobacteria bacterium]
MDEALARAEGAIDPDRLAAEPPAPFTRCWLDLPDGRMSYLEAGPEDAPALVFCHATGFNAQTYRTLLAPLAGALRILAPDQRGHGLTELPADPDALVSWDLYAADLKAFVAALGLGPALYAGHSMGGVVSLLAGPALGERLRGLVLLEPVILPRAFYWAARLPGRGRMRMKANPMARQAARRRALWPSRGEMLAAWRGRGAFTGWEDGVLADYIAGGTRADPEGVRLSCAPAFEAATFASQAHRPWAAVERVSAPVHLIAAGAFSTCPPLVTERLARRRPDWRIERVPGTGHFLPMERPGLVRAALLAAAGARPG